MADSKKIRLRGIVPPLVTPLLSDDVLDIVALERLVEHLLRDGVHGLFILGTTGEGASLSRRLQRQLISLTVKFTAGRAPVLVGISSSSLRESIDLAACAADSGAQAVVATTPYYFDISQVELVRYVAQLVSAIPLPLVLYSIPQRSHIPFTVDTVRKLLDFEQIVGIKDSSGDFQYFEQILAIASAREDFAVLMGQEVSIEMALQAGADGAVPGSANVFPSVFTSFYEAHMQEDEKHLCDLRAAMAEIYRMFYGDYQVSSDGISPLKFALKQLGIGTAVMASPLSALSDGAAAKLTCELARFQESFGYLLDIEPQLTSSSIVR